MAIDEQSAIKFARTILEGRPQTLDDLVIEDWYWENEDHELVILWLFGTYRDETIDWNERMWAYDKLREALRQHAETFRTEGELPKFIPPAIVALSLLETSGNMEPPAKPRGRSTATNALRNRKMLHIEKRLREEHGCKKKFIIRVIAKAAYMSEEGVESVLKRTRKLVS